MRLLGSTAVIAVGMERQCDNARAQRLAAHHKADRRAYLSVSARDVAHRDRRADAWPEPAGRDNAERSAVHRNDLRPLARWRATLRPNSRTLTARPIRQRILNPLSSRKAAIDASALLNGPGKSGFDRIYRLVEFMPIEAEAGLEPQRIARAKADRRDLGLAEEKSREAFRLHGSE